MSENNQEQNQTRVVVDLRKIYVNDVSVEVPHAPQIFQETINPEMILNIGHEVLTLPEENFYAVHLKLSLHAKLADERTVYLVSVSQGGVFEIAGLSEPQLHHALNVYCPTTLFPYARELIHNLTGRSGYPAFTLEPINFEAIYQERIQEFLKEQGKQENNNE